MKINNFDSAKKITEYEGNLPGGEYDTNNT